MSTIRSKAYSVRRQLCRSSVATTLIRWTKNREQVLAAFQAGIGITWMLVFLIGPLIYILSLSFWKRGPGGTIVHEFTLANYQQILTESVSFIPFKVNNVYLIIIGQSVKIGAIVTALTLLIGYVPAYYLGRTESRWKPVFLLLVVLPFWAPLIIRYYAWIQILGNNGLIPAIADTFGVTVQGLLYNEIAVISGLVQALLPFMILPIYNSINKIEDSLIEGAMTMNASPLRTFYEVTLPLSLPGVAAGSLMVFILGVGSYLAPALLGGPADVLVANLIEKTFGASYNWPLASALAVLYVFLLFVIITIFNYFVGVEDLLTEV